MRLKFNQKLKPMSRADERVLEVMAQITALSTESFEELCKLAVRLFSSNQQSKRRLSQAASTTGWEMEQLEQAVLVIAKVILDGAKANMLDHAFRLNLEGIELPEQHVEVLALLYTAHVGSIRECVSRDNGINIPQYRNLEWRIDLELGTRFHRNKPKPIVTLRLDTSTEGSSSDVPQFRSTCLRIDYDALKLMQRQLETALEEVDSIHCSRIQRYMY